MRVVIVATATCLSVVGLTAAADVQAAIRKSSNIPAQGVGPALQQLAKDHDFQVLYRSEIVGARRTRGASGDLTSDQALEQLLSGTGLTYRYLDEKTVTIVPMSTEAAAPDPQGMPAAPSVQNDVSRVDPGQESASQGAWVVEEVIVTAQKRAESMQRIPVAVTALDAEALAARNVANMQDIAGFAPNVRIARSGNSSGGPIFIRGVGQNDGLVSADPGVGVYLDGVYLARMNGSLFDLLDVERVEVLRGPQGTLYGKNTIGGAVNVISRQPSEDFSASLKATVGSSQERGLVGSLNSPLASNLFFRASALHTTRDGYTRDTVNGGRTDGRDAIAGRIQLRYLPTDALDVQLTVDANRRRDGQSAVRRVSAGTVIAQGSTDPFVGAYDTVGHNDGDVSGAAAHVRWTGSNVSIVSISAYRDIDEHAFGDRDGGPTPNLRQTSTLRHHEMSQELQFLGSGFDERLRWIAGLYAFREKARYFEDSLINQQTRITVEIEPDNTSYAAFGQADWKFTDKLTATAGLRFTREEREIDLRYPPFMPEPIEKSWSEVTPRFSLAYQATDRLLAYITAAQGFKAGQFNARARSLAEFRALEPEFVWSYEAGAKTQWVDGRLQLNVAAFFSDYTDIQLQTFVVQADNVGFVSSNAPKGEVQGVELELAAQPIRQLRLQATLGLLDAKFTDYRDLSGADLSGRKFAQSPETTYSFAGQYTHDLSSAGALMLSASYTHQSKVFNDVTNSPGIAQEGYGLLNGRLTYLTPGELIEFSFYGRNLTDEHYLSNGVPLAGLVGADGGYFGAPRTYGIEALVRFE